MKKPYEEFSNLELVSYAILVGGGRDAKELSSLKNLLKDNAPEEVEEFFYNFYNRFIKRDFHANRNNRKKYLENLLKEEYEKVMEMQTPLEDGIKINDNIVCDAFTNIVVDLNYFIKMYPDVYLKKYYEKDISKYLNSSLPYLEALISNRLINIKNFSELLCNKMIDKSLVKDFDSKTVKVLLKMADYTTVDKEIIKQLSPKVIRHHNLELQIFPLDIERFAEDMLVSEKNQLKFEAITFLRRGDLRLGVLANDSDTGFLSYVIDKIPWQFLPSIAERYSNEYYIKVLVEKRFEQEEIVNSIRRAE
jgi:hypothetical protein